MIYFKCPFCSRNLEIKRRDAGRVFDHPHCGAVIQAPDPANAKPEAKLITAPRNVASTLRTMDGPLPERRKHESLPPAKHKPTSVIDFANPKSTPDREHASIFDSEPQPKKAVGDEPHETRIPKTPEPDQAQNSLLEAFRSPAQSAHLSPEERERTTSNLEWPDRELISWDVGDPNFENWTPNTCRRLSGRIRKLIAACSVGLIALGIYHIVRNAETSSAIREQIEIDSVTEKKETQAYVERYVNKRNLSGERIEAAGAVLDKFMDARSWQELKPMVRNPKDTIPLMEEYYSRHPFTRLGIRDASLKMKEMDGRQFVLARATDENQKEHKLVIELTHRGGLVDWVAHVPYNRFDLGEIPGALDEGPVQARVLIDNREVFYGPPYEDEEQYLALRLLSPEQPDKVLIGYVDRKGTVGSTLRRLFKKLPGPHPVVLSLRHSHYPSASEIQVEIADLLAEGWLCDNPR